MLLDKEIMNCEFEYIKCFSEFYEKDNIIRFSDNQLKDMYYHNYTYVKREMEDSELKEIIEDEILLRLFEKSKFCNIILDYVVNKSLISSLKYNAEISKMGYYSFDISYFSRLNYISECAIKKVINEEMLNDVLFCDLKHDEENLGKDFCTRRCYRRGKVYVSEKGVNSYVCYHKGNIIGNCDLFTHNGVAKIEDFAVIPPYQRMGYGTTILKYLIDIAIKERCHTIYLVTDEEDTAKEMYKKLGFNKIGERMELLFHL